MLSHHHLSLNILHLNLTGLKVFYQSVLINGVTFLCDNGSILCLSSSVGAYVWSHLTSVLRSEDPSKQSLIESLPDDVISRDFEAEFLKYSSFSDYTVATGINVISAVN